MPLDRCSTCREWHDPVHMIPVIGLVCTTCRDILERPTLLEGVISGDPLASIAKATQAEINQRTEKLKLQAQDAVLAARIRGKSRFSVSSNPWGVIDENRPGMIALLGSEEYAKQACEQMKVDGGASWEWSPIQ